MSDRSKLDVVNIETIETIFGWVLRKLKQEGLSSTELDQNFYRVATLDWIFDRSDDVDLKYGSLSDELQFMNKSVLNGEDDLLDVTLERLAYLLLALSDRYQRQ